MYSESRKMYSESTKYIVRAGNVLWEHEMYSENRKWTVRAENVQ